MEELYFTIAGCDHYFGSDFMKKGMKVKLEKEPDNKYDKIGDKAKGKIMFVIDGGAVCRITATGLKNTIVNERE